MEGDFVGRAGDPRAEMPALHRNFAPDRLARRIAFAGDGSVWTVMGFLRGIHAHRACHPGSLDIYLRQADAEAPDFFAFSPKTMA